MQLQSTMLAARRGEIAG